MRPILNFFLLMVIHSSALAQQNVSHNSFDELLRKYVNKEGLVNYVGLNDEREKLKSYLNILEVNPPSDTWSKEEKLAYWINAYNAYTLELILQKYPIESIKDIGAYIQVPFVNTPWDIKFIHIGDDTYDLNNIEHGIIRKQFNEPRIHFALVCAAVSCPKLLNEAYCPERLEMQLEEAAKTFLNDTSKNEFKSPKNTVLSKIFLWYGGDFKQENTLISYLNRYAPIQLNGSAKIDWKEYDWSLNEQ